MWIILLLTICWSLYVWIFTLVSNFLPFQSTFANFCLYTAIYFLITEIMLQTNWMTLPGLKHSKFSKIVNYYLINIDFTDESLPILKKLEEDPQWVKRNKVHAVGSHGRACLCMSILMTANGSLKFPEAEMYKNARSIGHWFIKSIPFIGREFLGVFGLIDSTAFSIKRFFSSKTLSYQQYNTNNGMKNDKEMWNNNTNYCADSNTRKNSDDENEIENLKQTFPIVRPLKMEKEFEEINFTEKETKENIENEKKAALKRAQGKNIIVHPCGIGGKIVCCSLSNEENFNHITKKIVIPIYKRERKGFITMAIEQNALLIPYISLHEQYAYKLISWLPTVQTLGINYPFPTWLYGRWWMPFLPLYYMPEEACFGDETRSMKVVVGNPIDCLNLNKRMGEDVELVVKKYYAELERIAEKNNCEIRYFEEKQYKEINEKSKYRLFILISVVLITSYLVYCIIYR